jgi:hypothetical protein
MKMMTKDSQKKENRKAVLFCTLAFIAGCILQGILF